jgi:hypothetical protein
MLMSGKLAILTVILLLISPLCLHSQVKSAFSGDATSFSKELTAYMGPNLKDDQIANLNKFLARWDSAAFSSDNMVRIMDISSQLSSRALRASPHFSDFIMTLNSFADYNIDKTSFTNWLSGLSELAFNPRFTNENIGRYFKNTSSMLKEKVLFDSGTVRWKVKNKNLEFRHDTVFCVSVSDATLTCYTQKDSTEIYKVTGIYYPEIQQFRGTQGKITWEKAGSSDIYAELDKFTINTTKNIFTFDSVRFTNPTWFKKPVTGTLSDQAISFTNKDRANFPKFESYTKQFLIKDVYKGVNYQGGLSFEGANVKGTGQTYHPAAITLYRNDTLFVSINSQEFLFSKVGLNSQSVAASIYLRGDSIYHSNIGFSYVSATRQVNLFRNSNPVSRSPYFDSFHSIDMYFEYLSWNMNESKMVLSRARGASLGQAQFESSSFFNSDYFMSLMGHDDYHPLNRLVKFAEFYYSETFPVKEFARWLNKPEEAVTGLCMDLANKGFIFYNRVTNEVTIKKKTRDFLDSFARKKDYDAISIISETKAPVDNATLNLKDFKLTVNGVSGIVLSDSQKVAIYPYKQQIVIGRNREIKFDGVVKAGLFTIFGHNFNFSYDTFCIKLQQVDSIMTSVESDQADINGNKKIENISGLIQSGTAKLFIDNPGNKSGLKSYKQFPIIDVTSDTYIFYDKLAGLEDVYKKKDFYFRMDPFNFENIDHLSREDVNLTGEFVGGNILKPTRERLTIQENKSLGFNMAIPEGGIEIYEGRGRLFDSIKMSRNGLTGSGTLKHLTATTKSDLYKFFPDSMLTNASEFSMVRDESGFFPTLNSRDVSVKWLTPKDEWIASTSKGKFFDMFANGTTLDGSVTLRPKQLSGKGTINMEDSKITSNQFNFTANSIKADTADYNLKSRTTEGGYAFIAGNAKTDINFDLKMTKFSLNTDSSMVKFPEIQYICTMTDFTYDIGKRVLNMETRGKKNTELMSPDKLLRVNFTTLDKPTFFSTNARNDTISFAAQKGSYHLDQEFIEAENINYIHIADALIQPGKGKITIDRRAKIQRLDSAIIAINNKHLLHSATIEIESSKRFSGSAIYDYTSENKQVQQINFPEISVDTLTTSAKGFIPATQKFNLSPAFTFSGDVKISARANFLTFNGSAGINNNCNGLKSLNVKFKSEIDPENVMIPVSDKPRDNNDNLVYSGSFIATDSLHIYPAFLSGQKSYADIPLVNSSGWLYYEKAKGRYLITSREKIADQSLHGNQISFDKNFCLLSSEGKINFGSNFDLLNLSGAGKVIHSLDSGKVNIETILALDFYFSDEALKLIVNDLRLIPSLKPVNLNSEFYNKGMKDLVGVSAATAIKGDIDLFGTPKNMPREFNFELLLNDVNLVWNEVSSSFRSTGKIGVGFIGQQAMNVYLDGFIDIQRRRSGDMIDIYLKASESEWYYFSYFRGVLMTQSSNSAYNGLIANTKLNDRKHPDSSVRVPYTYMISSEDRLKRFLRRMTSDESEEDAVNQ